MNRRAYGSVATGRANGATISRRRAARASGDAGETAVPAMPIEVLQQMPIFGALRDDVLQQLLQDAREFTVHSGELFFRENDAASSMFVLETGSAVVTKQWQGLDFVLRGLMAGDCFGEMALMDLQPRSASVRAETECLAIELTAAGLMQLFESDIEQFALMQMNIGREVCRRLRATDDLLFQARMGRALSVPEALFRRA
jgi:CRP/FNR family transcriptional regulator, cyclic AMP receptor protein